MASTLWLAAHNLECKPQGLLESLVQAAKCAIPFHPPKRAKQGLASGVEQSCFAKRRVFQPKLSIQAGRSNKNNSIRSSTTMSNTPFKEVWHVLPLQTFAMCLVPLWPCRVHWLRQKQKHSTPPIYTYLYIYIYMVSQNKGNQQTRPGFPLVPFKITPTVANSAKGTAISQAFTRRS